MAFNLADVLGNVSNLGTDREQIEYIDIDLIDDDPNNFYELSELDELAGNIELLGLQQPLRVRPNPDDPERVIIVSGHRRRAAIRKLVEDGKDSFREIACIREQSDESAAMQELRLIFANSSTRKLSSADQGKQAQRVEDLLYQLKEEGVEFPGRMRDHVAQACQMSKSKLARLKVIRENLIPEFQPKYESGEMPEAVAYTMARFPEDFQLRLHGALNTIPSADNLEAILNKYNNGVRWEPDFTCSDGCICKRGDSFLRHDLATPRYAHCKGETCCLNCREAFSSYGPCERACSKAKAKRKENKRLEDEKVEKSRISAQRKIQKDIQRSAKRLVIAADAAGLKDSVEFSPNWTVYQVGELREWAKGSFGNNPFYSDPIDPGSIGNVIAMAKVFKCSADYVLGLTDDLHVKTAPVEGWLPLEWLDGREKPTKTGQKAVAVFNITGLKKPWKRLAEWNGRAWVVDKHVIDDPCLRWFPIPEDE